MRKSISLILAAALALSLAACGGDSASTPTPTPTPTPTATPEPTPTPTPEPQEVLSNACMSIDGVYVDDSWSDGDNSPLRMVYLLYTLTANDTNLQIDSKYTKMTINGSNSYESDHFSTAASAAKYLST